MINTSDGNTLLIKQAIASWFTSGSMCYDNFKIWKNWLQNLELNILECQFVYESDECSEFKKIIAKVIANKNGCNAASLRKYAASYINYSIQLIDSSEPCLTLTGAVIFLQHVKSEILSQLKLCDKKMSKVTINASCVINIDSSITLHGINFVLTAPKIVVLNQQTLNLSGRSFETVSCVAAPDGEETEDGVEGNCGNAGESSGHCLIITDELVNSAQLKILLNGGRGENGQSGGKGGPGKNGKGITEKEFFHLKVSYNTIYKDYDNVLYNYKPPTKKTTNWQPLIYEVDMKRMLMYAEYEDEYGRKIIYNYSGYKPNNLTLFDYVIASTTVYDLYFLVKGTDGTMGGIGGLGGFGGKGGHPGTVIITDYSGSKSFDVHVIRTPGIDGDDGNDGIIGEPGENGNDILFIDSDKRWRDTMEKHHYGLDQPIRIQITYAKNPGPFRRFDLYQKDFVKNDRYYACFDTVDVNAEVQNITERQAIRRQQQHQAKVKAPMNFKAELEAAINCIFSVSISEEIISKQETVVMEHFNQEINILAKNPLVATQTFVHADETGNQLSKSKDFVTQLFNNEMEKSELMKTDLIRLTEDEKLKFKRKAALTVRREYATAKLNQQTCVSEVSDKIAIMEKNNHQFIVEVKPKTKNLNNFNKSEIVKKFCIAHNLYNISNSMLKEVQKVWVDKNLETLLPEKLYHHFAKKRHEYDWNNVQPDDSFLKQYFPEALIRWTSAEKSSNFLVKTNQEIDKFHNVIIKEAKELNEVFKPLKNDRQKHFAVFGDIPEFEKEPTYAAAFLLRFKHQLHQMLMYRWLLYKARQLTNCETFLPSGETITTSFNMNETPNYLDIEVKNTEFKEIIKFLNHHGLNCAAFRLSAAYLTNCNIRVYGNENYGTFQLVESHNGLGNTRCHLVFPTGATTLYFAGADIELRKLIKIRQNLKAEFIHDNFNDEMQNLIELSFPEYQRETTKEWMIKYKLATNDTSLLQLFYERFDVDGNHISLIEFQFILNTAMLLQRCDFPIEFINQAFMGAPQKFLINSFLYLRIETVWRRLIKIEYSNIIKDMIQEVSNAHVKALLGVKAEEIALNETTLIQLLGLLQTASIESLEAMNLGQWIQNAKQIDHFLTSNKNCGMDYYVSQMSRSQPNAGRYFQELLQQNVSSPIINGIVTNVAYMITAGEIIFDDNLKFLVNRIIENRGEKNSSVDMKQLYSTNSRDTKELIKIMRNVYKEPESVLKPIEDTLNNENDQIMKYIAQIDAELSKKNPPIKLRDTQKLTIVAAVKNKNLLSQVKTGEGKTLIIAAIAIIRAKMGNWVDVITSSPVLAQRDCDELKELFAAFDLTVGHNCDQDIEKRKIAYKNNIVYGDVSHFERDYLLHNFYKENMFYSRKHEVVIIDEVDNMLIDNGNNVLYLSHNIQGAEAINSLIVFIYECVNRLMLVAQNNNTQLQGDFDNSSIKHEVLSDMLGAVIPSDIGDVTNIECIKIYETLIMLNVIDTKGYILNDLTLPGQLRKITSELKNVANSNLVNHTISCLRIACNRSKKILVPRCLHEFCVKHLDEFIENAKKSYMLEHNVEYVVALDGQRTQADVSANVTILDVNTGVDLPTSQWENGLHAMVQLKHGCRVSTASLKAVFTSNVTFLKKYKYFNGLSGTLGSKPESELLVDLYGTQLLRVPTDKPRVFKEVLPTLCSSGKEWMSRIFDETYAIIEQKRSVLLICRSIKDVKKLKQHFLLKDNSFWSSKIITYKRDSESCDFAKELPPFKVVISTNLAGRGTDIDINNELKINGGLHVIISFLPENQRIEEQAFGRAARCGCPGSGQIISMNNEILNGAKVNTAQVKEMRDVLETTRVGTMRDIYFFQTSTEECCLEKFRSYYDNAFAKESLYLLDRDDLPTLVRTVYFALLDEWALWLDDKWKDIAECSKLHNTELRSDIITSVDDFIKKHQIDRNNLKNAFNWIKFPEPFIAKALIELDKNQFAEAKNTMETVIKQFPEYIGEYYYYSGAIAQKQLFESTINEEETSRIANMFYIARCFFEIKKEEREKVMTLISRLQILASQNQHNIDGYYQESRQFESVVDSVLYNIDNIVGTRVNLEVLNTQNKNYPPVRLLQVLEEKKLLVNPTICKKIIPQQLKKVGDKYCITEEQLTIFLENQQNFSSNNNANSCKHFNLPSAQEFWDELKQKNCFDDLNDKYCYQLDPAQQHLIPNAKELSRIHFAKRKNLVVLTTVEMNVEAPNLYDSDSVEQLENFDIFIEHGVIKKCNYGYVNVEKLEKVRELSRFSFVKTNELADYLNVNVNFAQSVLNKLVKDNIIAETYCARRYVQRENCFENDQTVKSVLQVAKEGPFTRKTLIDLVFEPVTDDLLTNLVECGYLAVCGYSLCTSNLNCDVLPECICTRVKQYLVHQFSFSIARQILLECLKRNAVKDLPFNPVFLSLDPYEELWNDMQRYGLIIPKRIVHNTCTFENDNAELLRELIDEYKCKIDCWPFRMTVTPLHLKVNDLMVPQSVLLTITSSLSQLAVPMRPPYWWVYWLLKVSQYASCVTHVFGQSISNIENNQLSPKHVLLGLTSIDKVYTVSYFRQCVLFKHAYDKSPVMNQQYSAITHYHESACRESLRKQKLVSLKKGMLQKITKIGSSIRDMYHKALVENQKIVELAKYMAFTMSDKQEALQVADLYDTLSELEGISHLSAHVNSVLRATTEEVELQLINILEECLQQTELDVTEVLSTLKNTSETVRMAGNVKIDTAADLVLTASIEEIKKLAEDNKMRTLGIGMAQKFNFTGVSCEQAQRVLVKALVKTIASTIFHAFLKPFWNIINVKINKTTTPASIYDNTNLQNHREKLLRYHMMTVAMWKHNWISVIDAENILHSYWILTKNNTILCHLIKYNHSVPALSVQKIASAVSKNEANRILVLNLCFNGKSVVSCIPFSNPTDKIEITLKLNDAKFYVFVSDNVNVKFSECVFQKLEEAIKPIYQNQESLKNIILQHLSSANETTHDVIWNEETEALLTYNHPVLIAPPPLMLPP